MPDGSTKVDVARIAALARLALTPDEEALYRRQLAEILEYAEQVAAADTSGVAPTTHLPARDAAERDDVARPTLSQADALSNAPAANRVGGLFSVPRVIGG
jgi:aspartyl-tRNA(Asn)/glutamyl-tRNA(Gln) amidotransferase subunit C